MDEHDGLQEFFEEGVQALRQVIENGHGHIGVLDPLTDLPDISGNWKFGKEHLPHGDLTLTIDDPLVTGLKSVTLAGSPAFEPATKTLQFSLGFDELRLSSESFNIEGELQLLVKERQVDFEKTLVLSLQGARLDFNIAIHMHGDEPELVMRGTECTYGSIHLHIGHDVLANIILPWFKERITAALSSQLSAVLTQVLNAKLKEVWASQKPLLDKLSSLYKLKRDQGGWAQGDKPRVLEGFGGVGELPLPLLWELPSVDVANLEHRSVHQIMADCQTGDVLLFSGTAKSSQRIRRLTQCAFSHVVVVVKEPEFLDSAALIWQATSSTHRGVLRSMEHRPGIQLNHLEEMLHDYREEAPGANIVYRELRRSHRSDDEAAEARQRVIEFVREIDGKPYTDDMDGLYVMGLLEVDNPNSEDFFCAGLVAETQMRFGILNRNFRQYQYAPRDFSMRQECLPFAAAGSVFAPEVVVDLYRHSVSRRFGRSGPCPPQSGTAG